MIERLLIKLGIVFGILSIPTLFRKDSSKIWIPMYFFNCFVNYSFDKILVKTKQIKYPIRLFPKVFKINVVYDFFICPFLSIWYCQSSYNSKFTGVIGKLILFSTPQAIYEILLERKTDLLKFTGKWKWLCSVLLIIVVKVIARGTLGLIKRNRA